MECRQGGSGCRDKRVSRHQVTRSGDSGLGLRGHSTSGEELVEGIVGSLAVGDMLFAAATSRRAGSLEGPGEAHFFPVAEFGNSDVLPGN